MTKTLSVKNKLGFVDASLVELDRTDKGLINSWIKNNNMVTSWILNSISKEIFASISFSNSTYEIWLDFKDRFQQSNDLRIFS